MLHVQVFASISLSVVVLWIVCLIRFNGLEFLVKMKGKTVMFVGDSLGLNQWESLICMIHAAAPRTRTHMTRGDPLSTFKFLVSLRLVCICISIYIHTYIHIQTPTLQLCFLPNEHKLGLSSKKFQICSREGEGESHVLNNAAMYTFSYNLQICKLKLQFCVDSMQKLFYFFFGCLLVCPMNEKKICLKRFGFGKLMPTAGH